MSTRFPELEGSKGLGGAEGVSSYQMTHHSNVRMIAKTARPQASFSYDLAPVEVIVKSRGRKWYEFITSTLALIGGTFTFMSLLSGAYSMASKQFKTEINKIN